MSVPILLSQMLVLVVLQTSLLCFGAQAPAMPVIATASSLSVLSFKEWKHDRGADARARYSKLETEYLTKKTANPKDSKLTALYRDLKYTKSYVDEIADLTVSDYFVGYLSRFKEQKKAFQAAAEKLDSTEVAELMTAYADSLLKTSGEGISTSQPGSAAEASK